MLINNKPPYKLCIVEFWGCVISSFRNFRHKHTPPSPSKAILMDLSRYTAADERGYLVIQCNIMHGRRPIKLQEHNMLPTIHKNSLWPACISQIIALFFKAHSVLCKQITDQLIVQYLVNLRLSAMAASCE